MEKRKVTISIGGQLCSFYSDDSDEYITELEQRVNAAMEETAGNSVRAVIILTDQLLRMEQEKAGQAVATEQDMPLKAEQEKPEQTDQPEKEKQLQAEQKGKKKAMKTEKGQISLWDLMDEQ